MKYVFVDFEMNPVSKKYQSIRKLCNREIIEIGAVILDETFKEIAEYKQYIKPQYNDEIVLTCSKLTGITKETVFLASHFQDVYLDFLEWCNKIAGTNNYQVYAWSENDLLQLKKELTLKKMDLSNPTIDWMLSNWNDFQRKYCDILGIQMIISLDKAVGSIGETFKGTKHDALWDARNTSIIFSLSQDKEAFYKKMKPILDLLKPEEPTVYQLGDIFNFDVLMSS